MTALKLRKWDSAEHLKTEEDMALYLEACLQEAGDDAAFIAKALGTIARAKGMSQLSRDTGLGRESLYKALSGEGNPSFATILKVTAALGIKLHAQPLHAVSGTSQSGIESRMLSRRTPSFPTSSGR
jgi:probable addiction module antidote protein